MRPARGANLKGRKMKKLAIMLVGAALAVFGMETSGLTSSEARASSTNWNVSLWGKRRAFTEHVEKLAELVSEKTNGEFTLNISYGGLSSPRENLDGISVGAFEMAQFCAGYHRDKNPTITVLELPFIGVSNLEEELAVSNAIYSHPATLRDLARWNAIPLMPSPLPQYNIAGAGEPRNSLAKFEGMRVRATGGIGQALKLVGASPTSVPANEVYSAMQSGIVETVAFAQHAHLSYKIVELADWWTENLNPGTVNCPVVVNKDAYKALSGKHKRILHASVHEAMQHYLDNYAALIDRWDSILKQNNIQRVKLPGSEVRRLERMAATPIRDEWIKSMSAQGLPAQELYDTMMMALEDAR